MERELKTSKLNLKTENLKFNILEIEDWNDKDETVDTRKLTDKISRLKRDNWTWEWEQQNENKSENGNNENIKNENEIDNNEKEKGESNWEWQRWKWKRQQWKCE